MLAGVIARAVVTVRRDGWRALLASTWTLAALAGAVPAILLLLRPGGSWNNLLTLCVFLAIDATIGFAELARSTSRLASRAHLFAVGQLLLLLYDPRKAFPTADDRRQADEVVAVLREAKGPVLVPDRPFFAVLAGKEPSYQTQALVDLRYVIGPDGGPHDLEERLASGYYALVVTLGTAEKLPSGWYPRELARHYRFERTLDPPGAPESALLSTGLMTCMEDSRPRALYVPNR
jgi:hypothetical protein